MPPRAWQHLLALGALVFAVRLVLFTGLDADPRFDRPAADAAVYHDWAAAWAEGRAYEFEPPGRPFWRSPGYPAVLSLVYRLAGTDPGHAPRVMTALQMLLGASATLAVAAAALRFGGVALAWGAALLCTLHGPLLFMECQLLPVGLATPLLTFAGLALLRLRSQEEPRTRTALAAGAMTGLAAVIRPNLGLAIPVLAALLLRRRSERRRLPLALAAALAPLLLTTAWNLARSGELVATGANGPFNLQFAYGPEAGPTFATSSVVWGAPARQAGLAVERAATDSARPVDQVSSKSASRHFGAQAVGWVSAHPGAAARLALEKLLGVFSWRDLAIVAPMAPSKRAIPVLHLLALPFPLLALLAFLGAWRDPRAARPALLFALLPVLGCAVLFFTYTRFRVPAVPLLALSAAIGLRALPGLLLHRRLLAVFLSGGALLIVASSSPWLLPDARASQPWHASTAHGWWQAGESWRLRYAEERAAGRDRPGHLDEAVECFVRADALRPQDPKGRLSRALLEREERGEGPASWRLLDALVRDFPEFGPALAELGVCEMAGFNPLGRPDPARAAALFERVLALGQMYTTWMPVWAEALVALGRTEEATEVLETALQRGTWDSQQRTDLEARLHALR